MKISPPLLEPLVLIATRDGAVVPKYAMLFRAAGYEVTFTSTLEETLEMVESRLPHLIFADSFLPDGHAGDLFDALQEDQVKRRIPILVYLTSRDTRELIALNGRSFAAFFVGDPLPKAFAAKLQEVEAAKRSPSPYWIRAEHFATPPYIQLSGKATLLGLYQEMLVFKTPWRLNPSTPFVCTPPSPMKGPIELRARLCLSGDDGYYAMVPRDSAPPTHWLASVPLLITPHHTMAPILPAPRLRRILFCHPSRDRATRLKQLLDGKMVEVVHVVSLAGATAHLRETARGFSFIYLHELLTDRNRSDWLAIYNAMPHKSRPPLYVGTVGTPPLSGNNIYFLEQPVEVKTLAGLMMANLDGEVDGKLTIDWVPLGRAVLDCTLEVQARMLGFSESALIIEHPFEIGKGQDITLSHAGLAKLWAEQMRVKVMASAQSPADPSRWQSRLPAPLGQKTKRDYWQYLNAEITSGSDDESQAAPSTRTPFNANVINVFIQSTYEVCEYYTGELPRLGKPSIKTQAAEKTYRVCGVTTITGASVEGFSALHCDPEFVASLAFRIAGTPREEAISDHDTLREIMEQLCDQISGKARLYLESAGYVYDVALPKVNFGRQVDIQIDKAQRVIAIPFTLQDHDFTIDVCFVEKKS